MAFKIATPDTLWTTVYLDAAIGQLRAQGGTVISPRCQLHRPVTGPVCTEQDSAPAAWAARMTGIDLIAAAPWVLFGVVLSAVCIRLLRSRRAALRHGPADQELARHRDPQDT